MSAAARRSAAKPSASPEPGDDDLQVSVIQPEDIYGPDQEQAAVDYLTSCGFDILDRDWEGSDGRLDIVAAERHTFVVFDVRRPHTRFHRPLHEITHVRQRQLRLLAAAWLSAHGRRFDQIRIDAIALTWDRGYGYTIEHVRGVGT